ncbi:MAG: SGNH/GDSL hydrolase family protein [Bryobacteraceae bacterium]
MNLLFTKRLARLLLVVLTCALATTAVTKRKKPAQPKKASTVKRPRKKIKATPRQRAPKPPRITAEMREQAVEVVNTGLSQPFEQSVTNPAALIPFYEMLYRQQQGQFEEPLRVLHYGDSHTAADEWTGAIRALLQEKFGDGGAGFTLPGYPFKGFRRFDLKSGESRRWASDGLVGHKSDGFNGLGGVSIYTDRAGETVSLEADCKMLELFYLQQPGGGSLQLTENGAVLATIPTDGETAPGFFHADVAPGPHRFELRTLTRAPVRLFGWVAEKGRGITYESMGINGAQASLILNWDEALLASHVARRNPALIILAYGTNEASNSEWHYENYYTMYSEVIRRFRHAAPAATILVVGPPERLHRVRGKWVTFESTDWIVQAQKDAAVANHCAFWDMRAKMGGKGSMPQWVVAGLAQYDYVHLTSAGYRRLGGTMFRDLMANYETFLQARAQAAAQEIPHGNKIQNR